MIFSKDMSVFYGGSSVAVSSIILIKKSVKLHKSVFVQNKLFLLQFLVSGSWSYKTLGWKYYIGYSKGILDALKPTGILKTLPVCVKIPQPGRKYSPAVKIKIPNGGVMSRWHQASVYLSEPSCVKIPKWPLTIGTFLHALELAIMCNNLCNGIALKHLL